MHRDVQVEQAEYYGKFRGVIMYGMFWPHFKAINDILCSIHFLPPWWNLLAKDSVLYDSSQGYGDMTT